MTSRLFCIALVCIALQVACGPGGSRGGSTLVRHELPADVSGENLDEALRLYHSLPPDHPDRIELRARLMRYYVVTGEAALESQDLELATERFANMTDLLLPEDFAEGRIPEELAPFARRMIALGSPLGDEARVLAGYRALHGRDETSDAEYAELAEWGQNARTHLPNAMEKYTQLIEVWDEHARLTPAPDVLSTLAQLHVDRRDAVLGAFREGASMMMAMQGLPTQIMRIAPLDVAAVYLQHSDIASAINHVQSMGDGGETEVRLLAVLESARSEEEGADALIELSEAYREARPLVARGICRLGLQRYEEDARFAACLARLATAEDDAENATAWYARAIELAPDVRGFYDEALEQLDQFLERGVFDQDASRARALAQRADRILDERMRRFPNAAPPVARERIQLLVGSAEMSAGNADAAATRLEASIEEQATPDALEQLGILRERTGRYDDALRAYRRGLDLSTERVPRAQLLEHMGDAFAGSGDAAQSARMYRQALVIWDAALGELGDHPDAARLISEVQLRRGVLLGRLGEVDESKTAFRASMSAGSQNRSIYATILSYQVTAEPDPEFAAEVFRRAQRQITLAPEWKVYFALWTKSVAARAGEAPPDDVAAMLSAHADQGGWSGNLARFGAGDLPLRELLDAADGEGQRTEAYFYGGVDLIGHGDPQGARGLFERALTARMVGFYEYAMAQELLRQ